MTITQVFFRIWKALSLPLLVATLLICYFNLPDQVAFQFDQKGKPSQMIQKQSLFYWSVAIIIIINILMGALGSSLKKVIVKILPQSIAWSNTPIQTGKLVEGWINGLNAILNTFLMLFLISLNSVNATENQILNVNFSWIMIACSSIFILILFYFPISLLYTKPEEE